MSLNNRFVIRVYGVGMHMGNVLVADEYWFNTLMTKFPGGGLEYGEGPIDCLKRECREEIGQEVKVLDHIYTTDYFQETRFHPGRQLISIYYLMELENPLEVKASNKKFDFEKKEGAISFRWIPISRMSSDDFTLPIDKLVAEKMLVLWDKKATKR